MTKLETIRKVTESANNELENITVNQKLVDIILTSYSNVIIETLKENHSEKVTLPNVGTFSVKEVAERRGTSALNGEKWIKPSHSEIIFKPNKSVKDI